MKATIGLAIPENAELQIDLRMTVGEARQLRAQIDGEYPGWKFAAILRTAIATAERPSTKQGSLTHDH